MTNKLACVVFLSICTYYTCQARYTANLESSHNYLDDTWSSNQENNRKSEPSRSGRQEPTRKILEDIPETFQPRKIQLGSKRDVADPGCECNGCSCIHWASDGPAREVRGTGNDDGQDILKRQMKLFNTYISTTQRNGLRRSDLIDYMGSRSSHGGHDEDDEGKRNNIAKLTY